MSHAPDCESVHPAGWSKVKGCVGRGVDTGAGGAFAANDIEETENIKNIEQPRNRLEMSLKFISGITPYWRVRAKIRTLWQRRSPVRDLLSLYVPILPTRTVPCLSIPGVP